MAGPSGAHAEAPEILDAVTSITAGADHPSIAELIAVLGDSGAFRMLLPKHHGPTDIGAFVTTVGAVGALDGSAGWLTAMFNVAAYDVAGRPGDAGDEVWNGNDNALIAACYRPQGCLAGTARRRRLTGRWQSVAGCEYADWLLLTADRDGAQSRVLVPRSEAHVEPVRNLRGLREAGMCDVTLSELPVTEPRIFQSACDGVEFESPARLPTPVVVGAASAASVVGSADGVWRRQVDQVRDRLAASYGSEEVTERTISTVHVARAASDIDAAKLQIAASLHPPGTGAEGLRAAARAHRQAAARARDAADQILAISRSHALDASDPVTRLWQDVHAAARFTLRLLDALDPE